MQQLRLGSSCRRRLTATGLAAMGMHPSLSSHQMRLMMTWLSRDAAMQQLVVGEAVGEFLVSKQVVCLQVVHYACSM